MKRIDILKQSLEKKEAAFNQKLSEHFNTVKQANGQPLNDKRNGRATLNKWESQNNTLRNMDKEVEKTKRAIEKEEQKAGHIEFISDLLPRAIIKLIEEGRLIQWKKNPHIFFVPGVDKARIGWDLKKKVLYHKYVSTITDAELRRKFASEYNSLYSALKTEK